VNIDTAGQNLSPVLLGRKTLWFNNECGLLKEFCVLKTLGGSIGPDR